MSEFESAVKVSAEKAVLKIINDGAWVMPDYANRFKIPGEFMADVWNLVDVNKVKALLAKRLESELSDRIVNHMAAEIATDIKQILGVKERREALRSVARNHIDEIMKAGLSDEVTA